MQTYNLMIATLAAISTVACSTALTNNAPIDPTDLPPAPQEVSPDEPRPDEVEANAALAEADDVELDIVAEEAPTQKPAPAITLDRESLGELQYETDFSAGWPEIDSNIGNESMVDGGYQIETSQALWTYTTRNSLAGYYAEVTGSALNCPEAQGAFGLVFNYVNDQDLNAFVVTCNNNWQVFQKNSAAVASTLDMGTIPTVVETASEVNIGVLRVADTYTLYINDVQIGEVSIAGRPPGDFGPYAQTTSSEAPISVIFSALEVYSLPTP